MNRKLPITVALLLAGLSLAAQEKPSTWLGRTFERLANSKPHFDSSYVFLMPFKWTVAVESELLRPGADLSYDFATRVNKWDMMVDQTGTLKIGLQDRPCRKLGLAAGYGSLRLGYGVQLGKRDGERNTFFGFGVNSASYGVQIRYYKTHPRPAGSIAYDNGLPVSLNSDMPGELRAIAFDGYYAFNRHRFMYNAASAGRHVQRRSAGSWMVAAKYLQGDFSLDPKDPIGDRLSGIYQFASRQLSVGGGYSYNWTMLHRDPVDGGIRGLRNLTVNATVLPMVSFLNLVRAGESKKDGQSPMKNLPTFSPSVRGAACYTLDRWSFCAEVAYARYGFRGPERNATYGSGTEARVKTSGVFHDFTVKGKVNLHF